VLVLEVFVVKSLITNPNKSFAEITVELPIKYVRYRVVTVSAGCPVVQQLDDIAIEKHCLELWADREVLKLHPWLARFIILGLLTITEWAVFEVFVWASEATADFRTTV
jgi:hypothetical protein